MEEPTAILRHEHQIILTVVNGLDHLAGRIRRGQGVDIDKLRSAVKFMREFADRCHHAKEEGILFPAMLDKGIGDEHGPIAQLLHEHKLGRDLVNSLEDSVDRYGEDRSAAAGGRISACIQDIVELYTSHIGKEDTVFLPMVDRLLSPEERKALYDKFEEAEREIGMDHERLAELAQSFMSEQAEHAHHAHA